MTLRGTVVHIFRTDDITLSLCNRMRYYTKSMQILRIGWLSRGREAMYHSQQSKVIELLFIDLWVFVKGNHHRILFVLSIFYDMLNISFTVTGSRIVISILCMPLMAGYVHPPKLGLPNVDEANISCNPAGPHLVCVLPPVFSSSFCIPAWLLKFIIHFHYGWIGVFLFFSFHFISFHKKIIMIDIDIRYPIFV